MFVSAEVNVEVEIEADAEAGGDAGAEIEVEEPPPSFEAQAAELCGTINVATAALVDVIAEVIAAGNWSGQGYVSIEHWVAVHCGLSPGRARGLCDLARRRDQLPETVTRFRDGRLSEDQVRPIARHVPAAYDASVAKLAEHATPNQIARVARTYRFDDRVDDEAATEDESPDPVPAPDPLEARRRSFTFGWDDDGNLRGSFCLPSEDGAIVKQALEASRAILFNERRGVPDVPAEDSPVTWADALVRLADASLGVDAAARPARDRYQVMLHVRGEDLDSTTPGQLASLHLGPAISPAIARAMSCDASVRLIVEQAGVPVNEGHKYRTVPDSLRRVIEDRDGGCRYPGCNGVRWLVVHHIVHWRDGGATETHNLVALCALHHRLLHQGQFRINGDPNVADGLTFTNRFGAEIPSGPRPAPPADPPPTGDWQHPTGEHLDSSAVWLPRSA